MLSKLVLGTVQLGLPYGVNNLTGQPSQAEANEILNLAVKLQIQSLDTSDLYGSSCEVIRSFGSSHFRILSKFALASGEHFSNKLETSLARTGVSSLQGYSFHRFSDFENFESWNEVEKAKSAGLIRWLGVSAYTNEEIQKACLSEHVDMIQAPFNIFDNWNRRGEVFELAKSKNKILHVRSIYLQGLFFRDAEQLPSGLGDFQEPLKELREIAKLAGLTVEQLCWAYVKSYSQIDGIVVGAETAQQFGGTVRASATPPLNGDQIQLIEKIKIKSEGLLSPQNWKLK